MGLLSLKKKIPLSPFPKVQKERWNHYHQEQLHIQGILKGEVGS